MPVTVASEVVVVPSPPKVVRVRTSPTSARARSLTAISPVRSGRAPEARCSQRRPGSSATASTWRNWEPVRPGTLAWTDVSQDGATAPTESSEVRVAMSSASEAPSFEVTTAAVSTYRAPTASRTVLREVSLSTSVATTKPTAMTTASVEAISRAACARIWARRTVRTSQAPSPRERVEHGLRGRGDQLAGEPAVGEQHDAVGVGGGGRVVGDHDDRLAGLLHAGAQQAEHLRAGARVEVAGGLVGEDDVGPGQQGAGDRDPLLLAAGQLVRAVAEPLAQAEAGDDGVQPGRGRAAARPAASAARCSRGRRGRAAG